VGGNANDESSVQGGTMKIRINKSMCVGNARCAAVAPELFPLDDEGYIAVEEIEVPAGMEESARRGAKACPERIIVIEE
jgi:ferredoxin